MRDKYADFKVGKSHDYKPKKEQNKVKQTTTKNFETEHLKIHIAYLRHARFSAYSFFTDRQSLTGQ